MVRFARAQVGDRADDIEWNVLVQFVKVTGDRPSAAAELEKHFGGTLSATVMETPFLLFGTVDEITGQIMRNPGTVRVHLLHGACSVRRGIRAGHRAVRRFIAKGSGTATSGPPRAALARNQITTQKWSQPCAPLPRVGLAVCLARFFAGPVWDTAGADGLVSARRAGRGRRVTRALTGAVPVTAGMTQGRPGKDGAAGRRRAGAAGPGARCGRPPLPAVVPAAAGTPRCPASCPRSQPPQPRERPLPRLAPGSGRHRPPAAVSPCPGGGPGPAPAPAARPRHPYPVSPRGMPGCDGGPRPSGRE